MSIFRRLDDYAVINDLINKSYIVIIVPRKNVAIAWLRKGERYESDRVVKRSRTRNGIEVVHVKLSL